MYARPGRRSGFGVSLPFEEFSKRKMLDYWEFTQHFSVVHLQHALIDLSPTVFDARDVEQDR